MMQDKKFADRAIYKVLVKAPIETVWSELIKTTSPRPFFWNSSWDAKDMAPGNAYRMVSNSGKTVASYLVKNPMRYVLLGYLELRWVVKPAD